MRHGEHAHGGIIIFGVADEGGAIVGLSALNQAIDIVLRAARMIKPAVALAGTGPETYVVEGKRLPVVQVSPNNGTLYQPSGVTWMRRGSYTTPVSVEEISRHLYSTGALQWETTLCPHATLDDLDPVLIERYIKLRNDQSLDRLRHTSIETILTGLKCAAIDPQTQVLRPTQVGMLVFGHNPQFHIPQSELVCVRYNDALGAGTYVDRKIFKGTLTGLIDQAADFVQRYMRVGAEIIGFKRVDLPEYPIEALREAIVNAVTHRDYSRADEAIRVFFYSDRIEVRSPGLLPPSVTVDDLVNLRVPSRPRNPLIAQFLRDIPGYVERIGMGIRLMLRETRQLGLLDPAFIEQHEFVVIFRNRQTADTSTGPFNPRQVLGLQIIQQRGSISNREYSEATGASERTALRELREMVERGAIVVRGKTRSARYFLP